MQNPENPDKMNKFFPENNTMDSGISKYNARAKYITTLCGLLTTVKPSWQKIRHCLTDKLRNAENSKNLHFARSLPAFFQYAQSGAVCLYNPKKLKKISPVDVNIVLYINLANYFTLLQQIFFDFF